MVENSWSLVVATMLVNNVVLSSFLGLCPFVGVSESRRNAVHLSVATTFVLTLVASLSFAVFKWVLIPFHLEYLKTLTLIVIIAMIVQGIELIFRLVSPLLHQNLGLYLPLMTSNCAVLGVALLVIHQQLDSLQSALLYGLSAGLGFSLVLILLSQIRHRVQFSQVPTPWQGAPIALITAAIMSVAFMGFQGLM